MESHTPERLTALQYLMPILKGKWDHSANQPGTGQSVRRWIKDKAVHINGFPFEDLNEIVDFPIFSLVLFPNNPRRKTTLW